MNARAGEIASETGKPFWELRERFKANMRRLLGRASAEGESLYGLAPPITPLNERLIQAIWANQLVRGEGLRLIDGRAVRVLDPGRWNGSAGPDFKGARIEIDAREVQGDVEVHLNGSHWRAHRHEADLDYNRVILHVVHRSDDGRADDPLHNGGRAPRLELESFLFPDLETIQRSMTPDDYPYERPAGLGKCHEMMVEGEAGEIADFLDKAGDERLSAKVRRLEDQERSADLEQVFHQSLMMTLGSGPSRSLYYLLAKRTPVAQLFDYVGDLPADRRALGFESILMHVGGLAPKEEESADAPESARRHAEALRELWRGFEPYWADRAMAPTRRWRQGLRPVNFPERRLAAVARMLARSMETGRPILAAIGDRVAAEAEGLAKAKAARRVHPALKDLFGLFEIEAPGSFWATHYSFRAKPAARAMVLIGQAAARSLVFNAVLPALVLLARRREDEKLEAAARRLYAIFPPLPDNHITDFMSRRLFGETTRAKDLMVTERRRQGLYQIFYSCCNGETRTCDRCYYLNSE